MDILCLDIGGTSTRAALVGESGIQNKLVIKTPFSNKDEMLNQTINLVKDFCNLNSVNAISIGCAGPVYNSIMQGSEPMGISDNINFKKIINEHFNIPTYVENDLQMAIRAERKYGFGRGIKNFVVISLSTGIGVAVIKNNIILEGRIEIGHNIIDINKNYSNTSTIGHAGTWVSLASGSAIQSYIEKYNDNISIEDFFIKTNRDFIKKIQEINTFGFTQVIHAYDPEIIIVMGSLGINQFEKIIPNSSEIEKICLLRPIPDIIKTSLGDDIGILGAHELAIEKLGI